VTTSRGDLVGRLFKWLLILVFAIGLAVGGSYSSARFASGSLLGPKTPVEGRSVRFAFEGVSSLAGSPRAWVFTYNRVRLPDVHRVEIVISLTGKVLSVTPRNLEQRLDAYEASLEP
jgi:hypothetical protein